jgi:hypothetical protein
MPVDPAAPPPSQATLPGTAPPAPPAAPAAAPVVPPPAAAASPPAAVPSVPRRSVPDRISISAKELRRRVDTEAATRAEAKIKEELGCSIEEAKAILAERRAAAGGAPDPATGDQPGPKELARIKKLEKERDDALAAAEDEKKKRKRIKARSEDAAFVLELRNKALEAGVLGKHAAFAIDQFKEAVRASEQGKEPEAGAFFAGLRADHPYLFPAGAAPPPTVVVPVPGATAAPGGGPPAAGGAPPAASPPATVPKTPDALKMKPEDFRNHATKRYGFNPGSM